jgi:hypothetical protein
MITLHEIEELCKTVNRNAIKALLHNAAIMKDPAATPEMRAQAEMNFKAISHNKPIPAEPKPKKVQTVPAVAAQQAPTQLAQQPMKTPVNPALGQVKLKYSPAYQHYGVNEQMWNKTPDAQQGLFQHHNEVMAGKHPDLMHIKTAVEAAKPKILKSVDSLYDLFTELKKHL